MDNLMYKYANIELEQFALFEENMRNDDNRIKLQTETEFGFDKTENILCNTISVVFENSIGVVLNAVIKSYFLIHEETIKHITNGNKITFPSMMLIQFASLNYGSLRGMICLKAQDTKLSRFILPPLFFNKIITSDFIVE